MLKLSRKKAKLKEMADTLPKSRYESYERTNIIDYKYINYDLVTVRNDLDAVTEELSNAQLALDLINHTAVIDIDM